MRHDQPDPGKFEGNGSRRLANALYNISQDLTTTLGDVADFGWYGLVSRRNHGYIVYEDTCGFFSYTEFPTLIELDEAWTELETEYERFCQETEQGE